MPLPQGRSPRSQHSGVPTCFALPLLSPKPQTPPRSPALLLPSWVGPSAPLPQHGGGGRSCALSLLGDHLVGSETPTWQVHPQPLSPGSAPPSLPPAPAQGDLLKTMGRENISVRPGSTPTLQSSSWGSAPGSEEAVASLFRRALPYPTPAPARGHGGLDGLLTPPAGLSRYCWGRGPEGFRNGGRSGGERVGGGAQERRNGGI